MNSDSFRPSQLLFSQTSIKSTLSDGEHIPTLIHNISIGRTPIDPTWEPLDVAKDRLDGKYYCQNNRRLYIFRVLEKKGVRNQVRVKLVRSGRPKPPEVGPRIHFRDGTPTEPY